MSLQRPRTETTPSTVARMPGHVATVPKVPMPCSTVQTTSPPDKAFLRPRGSFSNEDHATYQHFVTLHLLEAIKGACRDRFRGRHTNTQLSWTLRGLWQSHTHSTLILRSGNTSLSHPFVTPATSTSVQDNTRLLFLIGRRAFFGPNQYKSLVFFVYTIQIPDTQTHITRWYLKPPFLTPTRIFFFLPVFVLGSSASLRARNPANS
jgi:hypothetical protein